MRSHAAGKYAIDIGGQTAGWCSSVEGGHCKADVVSEKVGADLFQHKHIAGVSYEDISIKCGTAMSKNFYEWIKASVDHQYRRVDSGAIISADYNFKETGRLNFFNALISEVGFPALDAASKDAAAMQIKFTPEYTRNIRAAGQAVSGPLGKGEQKKWTASNFTMQLDGCTESMKWVKKVEALTIKQKVVKNPVGEKRDYQIECASIEYPNVVITVSDKHADELYKWHEDFVINGNCTADKERNGALTFLASDTTTQLFTLNFRGLGIFALTPEKHEAGSENIKCCKVEMYCEQITFEPGQGSIYA